MAGSTWSFSHPLGVLSSPNGHTSLASQIYGPMTISPPTMASDY